jgi:hypothetical protein
LACACALPVLLARFDLRRLRGGSRSIASSSLGVVTCLKGEDEEDEEESPLAPGVEGGGVSGAAALLWLRENGEAGREVEEEDPTEEEEEEEVVEVVTVEVAALEAEVEVAEEEDEGEEEDEAEDGRAVDEERASSTAVFASLRRASAWSAMTEAAELSSTLGGGPWRSGVAAKAALRVS